MVDAATVDDIVAALRAQGVDLAPHDGEFRAELNWAGTMGRVGFGAFVMLPDDRECPTDIAA